MLAKIYPSSEEKDPFDRRPATPREIEAVINGGGCLGNVPDWVIDKTTEAEEREKRRKRIRQGRKNGRKKRGNRKRRGKRKRSRK